MGPKIPPDLDAEGRKKWRQLLESLDEDVDGEALGLYCRTHANLMAVRREKAKQEAAGTFQTTLAGRDGAMQLNPLLTAENRMVATLNRMLRTLGLAPTRDQQDARKKVRPNDLPPPGLSGPEPSHGWALELALCSKERVGES